MNSKSKKWFYAFGLGAAAELLFYGIMSMGLMPSNRLIIFVIDVVVIGLFIRLGMDLK